MFFQVVALDGKGFINRYRNFSQRARPELLDEINEMLLDSHNTKIEIVKYPGEPNQMKRLDDARQKD